MGKSGKPDEVTIHPLEGCHQRTVYLMTCSIRTNAIRHLSSRHPHWGGFTILISDVGKARTAYFAGSAPYHSQPDSAQKTGRLGPRRCHCSPTPGGLGVRPPTQQRMQQGTVLCPSRFGGAEGPEAQTRVVSLSPLVQMGERTPFCSVPSEQTTAPCEVAPGKPWVPSHAPPSVVTPPQLPHCPLSPLPAWGPCRPGLVFSGLLVGTEIYYYIL